METFDNPNSFNTRQLLTTLLDKWYWIAASVLLCLAGAYLVNRYTTPTYQTETVLYVKDALEKAQVRNLLYSDQSAAERMAPKKMSDESVFLKSYGLVESTLRDLRFDVSYYHPGNVRQVELYRDSPVRLAWDTTSTDVPYGVPFTCRVISPQTYRLETDDETWQAALRDQLFTFGTPARARGFAFTTYLQDPRAAGRAVTWRLHDWASLTEQYIERLQVAPKDKESSLLVLSLVGPAPPKEKDFLDRLLQNFVNNDVADKNLASNRTVGFIDQLLLQNRDSLNQIERRLERFKSANATVDLGVQGTRVYDNLRDLEKQRASLTAANRYFDYLDNSLRQNKADEPMVLPSLMGVQDAFVDKTIESILALQLENKVLRADRNLKNPFLEENLRKVDELKSTLRDKVRSLTATNQLSLQDIDRQASQYLASQRQLPTAERQLVNIQRVYGISEALVQFLMEKRAEAGITSASNSASYKVVDRARQVGPAVAPRVFNNYLVALTLGLLLPVGLLFAGTLLNGKVVTKEDITRATSLPILGMVVRNQRAQELVVDEQQRSASSESFRSLRANLSYVLEENGQARVILVTSAVSGEGKSYCAKNLAAVLALAGKKTLLINGDMRKPGSAVNGVSIPSKVSNVKGLSSYLAGKSSAAEAMLQTELPNFCLIEAGSIPPNPSELLLGERMRELLATARQRFDYIVVDTPPIGVVSDASGLFGHADLTLFIVRQQYSQKSFLTNLDEMHQNYAGSKMAIVFNGVDMKKAGYGDYGIGSKNHDYYENPRPEKSGWLRRLSSN